VPTNDPKKRSVESPLIKMAQDARRANLTSDTAPEPASLPEPDIADMEFFLDQVQMVLPVLSFDFTQPRPGVGTREGASSASPVFELRKVGAVATAQEIDGQFVVMAGSMLRKAVRDDNALMRFPAVCGDRAEVYDCLRRVYDRMRGSGDSGGRDRRVAR
jgi:hypothetical protein